MAFSVIIDKVNAGGRPFNSNKKIEMNQMCAFYDDTYFHYTFINKVSANNISYILGQTYDQMVINVVNNITKHFYKHVNKFVKCKFLKTYETIKETKNKEALAEFIKWRNKLVDGFFTLNDNLQENAKKFIEKHKKYVIPESYTEKRFESDVKKNTFEYIKCMHYMNKYIEQIEQKCYQIFPISSSCYTKYIKINTPALIDIFIKGNKLDLFKKSGDVETQELLWNKYFKLKVNNKYRFRLKKYSFNYEISTDGFGTSLNFISDDEIVEKERKKSNFRK